jgi:hypothetical protein
MCCAARHAEKERTVETCIDMETQIKLIMDDGGLENGDWEKRLLWKLKMAVSWTYNAKKQNGTVAVTVFRLTLHNVNSIREGLGVYN